MSQFFQPRVAAREPLPASLFYFEELAVESERKDKR